MAGYGFFIDTSLCTACRGCQVACKNWNQNPATKTRQEGTYQNPPDLSFETYKLVRMSEVLEDGKLRWLFFADQCRHCLDPPCKMTADEYVKGAIVQDPKTGAVWYDPMKTRELPADEVRESCPYNIPRVDPKTKSIGKCTMCVDRVSHGLIPACVKVCPTGTMNFGPMDKMLAMAEKRLQEVKAEGFSKAELCDADNVRVIYLTLFEPAKYHEFAVASLEGGMSRKLALNRMFRPLGAMI